MKKLTLIIILIVQLIAISTVCSRSVYITVKFKYFLLHFAYILLKYCDLLFLLVDCTGCRIQEITIMFWLVDMRLHFHFAVSDLFLALGHSDDICTGQGKWHAQDQRNAGKVELECFVKACFRFIETVKN